MFRPLVNTNVGIAGIITQLVWESLTMSVANLDFAELANMRPAWVIDALQAMASADVVTAATGMRCFEADPYYSEELSNVTAADVPFLLALLKPELHICRQLTILLGSLVGVAPRPDGETPYQRFQPLDPRLQCPSEIALTTAAAIRGGRVVFEALLEAEDAAVRCAAAWVLYQMAPVDAAALTQRLSIETDDAVRIALLIALAANQGTLPSDDEVAGSVAADVRQIIAAPGPIDELTTAAFARLLVAPPTPDLLFADGMLTQLAASHLVQRGPREPLRFALLRQAYENLNGRTPTPVEQLAVIETALAWVVFPDDTAHQCTLDRSRLTAAQRYVLSECTVEGFARVGLPAQQAFLRGDAALDVVIEYGGQQQTVATHILDAQTAHASLNQLFAALTTRLAPQQQFDLSLELLAGHLGPSITLATRDPIAQWCAATTTEQRIAACLPHELNEFQCLFLFHRYIAERKPSPSEFDAIACNVLAASFEELPAWLLTFPSTRRANLVAQLHHFTAIDRWQFCDVHALATCLLERYLSDQWPHDDPDAVQAMTARLSPVPTALLQKRCGDLRGLRKQALDDLLAKRLQRTSLTLSARKIWTMQLELRLPDGTFLLRLDLERLDQTGALELLISMIEQSPHCVVKLYPSVPPAVAVALRQNHRIAIVDAV